MEEDIRELFEAAERIYERIRLNDALPVFCIASSRIQNEHKTIEAENATRFLENVEFAGDEKAQHVLAMVVESLLRRIPDDREGHIEGEAALRITEKLCEVIKPPASFSERSSYDQDPPTKLSELEILRYQLLTVTALRALSQLAQLCPSTVQPPSTHLLTTLATFTIHTDPWTHLQAYETATALLKGFPTNLNFSAKHDSLRDILESTIKPLFTRSENVNITAAGRKTDFPQAPADLDFSTDEVPTKPWKHRQLHVLTVLHWVITQLTPTAVEQNWPLLIPPLLALLDDGSVAVKLRGYAMLQDFLPKTTSALMKRTGLGEVFHDALMPVLSYLPPLTEERESLELLGKVYPVMRALVEARFVVKGRPEGRKVQVRRVDSGEKGEEKEKRGWERQKVLAQVLRKGVLMGIGLAGEHVKVAEALLKQLPWLVNSMGIFSVKHLKELIPVLTKTLGGPFAPSYPPLMVAAIQAYEVIILNCWPRMAYWRGNIMEGITSCWFNVQAEQKISPQLAEVQVDLKNLVRMLKAAMADNHEAVCEVDEFLSAHEELEELR